MYYSLGPNQALNLALFLSPPLSLSIVFFFYIVSSSTRVENSNKTSLTKIKKIKKKKYVLLSTARK